MAKGVATHKKFGALIILEFQIANKFYLAKLTLGDVIKHYRETRSIDVAGKSRGCPQTKVKEIW